MKIQLQVAMVFLAGQMLAGEVVERIVAVVGSSPILLSEWNEQVRFEGLLNGRDPQSVTADDRKAALDRLMDQALIRQQMRAGSFQPPSGAEVAARVDELRRQAAGESPEAWPAVLARHGLTESDVRDCLRAQMEVSRFVEARFRPSVRIAPADVDRYYREQFLPGLRRMNAEPKPLEQVRAQIEEVLTQQQVTAQLNAWIETLRAQAHIEIMAAAATTEKSR